MFTGDLCLEIINQLLLFYSKCGQSLQEHLYLLFKCGLLKFINPLHMISQRKVITSF